MPATPSTNFPMQWLSRFNPSNVGQYAGNAAQGYQTGQGMLSRYAPGWMPSAGAQARQVGQQRTQGLLGLYNDSANIYQNLSRERAQLMAKARAINPQSNAGAFASGFFSSPTWTSVLDLGEQIWDSL